MGLLIDGVWHDQWYDTKSTNGSFERSAARFRNWITSDGKAGPTGDSGFVAGKGRYHLYVSLACPWSHRTVIFRKLKQLEDVISMSNVSPHMLEHGWTMDGEFDSDQDFVNHCKFIHQIYTKALPDYSGRVTVPVLWDKDKNMIVSNESSDIIRMFNFAFNDITGNQDDYCPEPLRAEIDNINELIYHNVNNGVYRCGFATKQQAYEKAFDDLFSALDTLEVRLAQQRYLVGNNITEADWRLFVTLVRFDAVYHGHFKCNLRRITDYHNLSNYLRDLYQHSGIAETVNFTHIKQHYYYSHTMINPNQIVPKGPAIDLNAAHDRNKFKGE